MSINIYVNSEPQSISKAIVAGLNQPQTPAQVREFVQGAEQNFNLYLIDPDGTHDSRSGSAGVSVRVSLSARNAKPTQGTFTLTDGTDTTAAIAYDASSATVEAALNALNGGNGPNGSTVEVTKKGEGCYVVAFTAVGDVSTISGTSIDLSPQSSVIGSELVTGSATVREQQVIELTAQPLIYQETWSTITNGWTGTLSANNSRVIQALGDKSSLAAYLEVKIDDVVVAQQDVQLYASASTAFAAAAAQVPNALTTSDIGVTVQEPISSQVIVTQASDFGTIDSSKVYVLDGIIDMGSTSIEVPAGGISIIGTTFDVSQLISSANNYSLFTSPAGGSGNVVLSNIAISTSGASSQVFSLTSATGFDAVEITAVNFNGCTSLGYLDTYRQGLETGTGRFGGTPELEFRGTWVGGYRTDTTIARGMSNFTSLFKAGAGFNFSGRVALSMNCDLPATGAFVDFAPSNVNNSESLQLIDCRITRAGVSDPSDTTIHPNIDHTSVKSLWSNNVGAPNTTKYIKASITAEVTTTISATSTYYPLAGTFTVDTNSHIDMPANGEFRLQSGNGTYQINGDLVIESGPNNVLDVRVTQSTDGGVTFPTEVTHIRRQVNSLVGGRDVAFFPINFIATIKTDDRLRIEVENLTSTSNATVELDSYFIITGI